MFSAVFPASPSASSLDLALASLADSPRTPMPGPSVGPPVTPDSVLSAPILLTALPKDAGLMPLAAL